MNSTTVFLFKRTASDIQPSIPTSDLTYTFSLGFIAGDLNGWEQALPVTGGSYRWVITAVVSSVESIAPIPISAWGTASLLSEDGISKYTAVIYKQTIEDITTPTGGSYSFSGDIFVAPLGWSRVMPSVSGVPTYMSVYRFSTNDLLEVIPAGIWGAPVVIARIGNDYVNRFKSICFRYSVGIPGTPADGSYNSPVPLNWSDGIPAFVAGQDLYVTSRTFYADGYVSDTWSVPVKITTATSSNSLQFSIDNVSWHEVPTTNDLYMRSGTNDGTGWIYAGSVRIKGEQGIQGIDGIAGSQLYTWIAYAYDIGGVNGFTTGSPTSLHKCIGVATNKTSASESIIASDYVWSNWVGTDGQTGADGLTTYTWFAYANTADGSTGFTTGAWTNELYIGLAFNKLTSVESTNPNDYSWARIGGSFAKENNIIIPYYLNDIDVNFSTIDTIISIHQMYPAVGITVILNPTIGFILTAFEANHALAISRLQAVGITVIGYVTTLYGGTTFGYYPGSTANTAYNVTDIYNVTVAKIDAWYQYYPSIDGIFFDEMHNGWSTGWSASLTAHITFYKSLSTYCSTKKSKQIIYNPGTDIHSSFFEQIPADCFVIIEDVSYPDNSYLNGTANNSGHQYISRSKKGLIVYDQPTFISTEFRRCTELVSWFYATDNDNALGELWSWISTYLLEQTREYLRNASIAGLHSGTTPPTNPDQLMLWFNTSTVDGMYYANTQYQYVGTSWIPTSPRGTKIDTNGIYTGTLTATQVNAVAIDAASISTGVLTGRTIQTASSGKRSAMYASDYAITNLAGEFHCWDNTGSGEEEIASIGLNLVGTDYHIAIFGTLTSTNNNVGALIQSGSNVALMAKSAAGEAILANSTDNYAAVVGTCSGSGAGVIGSSTTGHGVIGLGLTADASIFDFYAGGNAANYGPFTGAHEVLIDITSTFTLGDIYCDVDVIYKSNMSNCITIASKSSQINCNTVIGVLSGCSNFNMTSVPSGLKLRDPLNAPPNYELLNTQYFVGIVNALGEGQINICKDGGNILAGDYICTSSRIGKGMKQSDDLLHNYTVAKARESVTWLENEDDIRTIACTYHCG
jgi:hypothetical protein